MSTTRIYDAEQVTVSFAGADLTDGLADGEFLKITNDTDAFLDVVGTDGSVTRSKSNDGRSTIELKLMQTSPGQDILTAAINTDKLATNGAGIGAFLVRDPNGRQNYLAAEAWIAKEPDVAFDRTATERVWKFRVAKWSVRLDGGS